MKKLIILLLILVGNQVFSQENLAVIDTIISKFQKYGQHQSEASLKKKADSILKLALKNCKENPENCKEVFDLTKLALKKPYVQLNNPNTAKNKVPLKKIIGLMKHIKNEYQKENKFLGEFQFGLSSNNTSSKEQVGFNIEANVQRGSFPEKFNFKSKLSIEFNNGELIENLSDLSMSYDYHINNSLNHETYLFVKRSSNNFLNIEQRYEFGSGYVYNFYSGKQVEKKIEEKELKKYFNKKGIDLYKKYGFDKFLSNNAVDRNLLDEFIAICTEDLCKPIDIKKEKKDFEKILKRVLKSLKKDGSKWRIALLLGANYEVERTKDPINLTYLDTTMTERFEPTSKVRFVTAPIMKYSKNQFTLDSRCYFKVAISRNDFNNKVQILDDSFINPLIDEKIDFRIEWENSLSIAVTNKIAIVGTLNYQHINAPKRQYFNIGTTSIPNYQLFESDDSYLGFNVKFKFKL